MKSGSYLREMVLGKKKDTIMNFGITIVLESSYPFLDINLYQ